MAKTVVGLFETQERARDVVNALLAEGIARDDISLVARDEMGRTELGGAEGATPEAESGTKAGEGAATGAGIGAVLGGLGGVLAGLGALAIPGIGPAIAAGPIAAGLLGAAGGAVAGGIIGGLIGLGIPEEEAHAYAEGIRRGNILVLAKVADVDAGKAEATMNRFDPIDIHAESAEWRNEGWGGRFDESQTIPVTQEQLVVGKRRVPGGGVRVHSHVIERPVEADVRLQQERVQVERMPADRPVSDADRAFQERSLEAEETSEEAVVGKTARVEEEVRLKKALTEDVEHVEDTVRRTDVDVERTPPERRPT